MTAPTLPRSVRGRAAVVVALALLTFAVAIGDPALPAAHGSPRGATAAARGAGMSLTERAVVRIVNRIRARHGVSQARPSRGLTRAADYHSAQMIRHQYFAHASWNTRIHHFVRARDVGEVLAWLYPRHPRARHTPRGAYREALTIVTLWMHSPTHRAVLLDGSLRRIGVGRRIGRFGGRRAVVFTADFASAH